MEISLLRELSIKHSRQELTQKEIINLLNYLFEKISKIPSEDLIKELLTDAETLVETVQKVKMLL